jgi:hypothetical protein
MKLYKDDEEKRLPEIKRPSLQGGNNKKLEAKHTDFLFSLYGKNATAVLWEARDALPYSPELN